MKVFRVFSFSCLAIFAAGCSTINTDELETLIRSGQCQQAYSHVNENAASQTDKYLFSAVVARYCERDKNKAERYLNVPARRGNSKAIEMLVEMGRPVPAQDLKDNGLGPAEMMLLMQQQKRRNNTTCLNLGNGVYTCD